MTTALLREPSNIAALPHDRHGRPVPWFAAWLDEAGRHARPAPDTSPDFRVVRPGATVAAWASRLCWVCGRALARQEPRAFVIGPMCAVNLISAEPPAHHECAVYSARACPFLATPNMVRRDRHLPQGTVMPPGEMIMRNPGVVAVWVVKYNRPTARAVGSDLLFNIGHPPMWVEWYARARPATRSEVLASITSGLPALAERCEGNPSALADLRACHARALEVVPR